MDSRDKVARKNIGNILNCLGFKDTPESRKLDPWMISVLKCQEQQQEQQQPCSSQKPPVLPLKKRPFIDLDAKNYDGQSVSKPSRKFKKQRTGSKPNPALPVQKELPVQLKNMILEKMGGSDLMFVFEKTLEKTDLSTTHCRLTIPEKQVSNEFLTNEEKRYVRSGIDVKLVVCDHDYEPSSSSDEIKVKDINLIKWALTSTYTYALNRKWNSIVKEYKLQKKNGCSIVGFSGAESTLFCTCQALNHSKRLLIMFKSPFINF